MYAALAPPHRTHPPHQTRCLRSAQAAACPALTPVFEPTHATAATAVLLSDACVYLLMFEGVYIMSSLDALVLARAYRNTYLFHQATAEIRAGGRKISRAQTVRVMFAQQSNSLKEPRSLVTAATSPPGVLASALDAKGTAAEDKT